ncbi:RcnB family protein [Sphingomonas sp. Leaf343]|uniref:RcnB family protein n=1 Tax=Sphingomonas sp. Leaf343 TaxID=1736345 RepID=UPI0009E75312|nr:RcnB family protein [Sphingomonas sp. Leaf343]
MRNWISALLMATTLIPVAAAAQEGQLDGNVGRQSRGDVARIRADMGARMVRDQTDRSQMDRGRREDAPRDEARPQPRPAPQLREAGPDQPRPERRADRGNRGGNRDGMDQRYPRRDDDRNGWQGRQGQDRQGPDRPRRDRLEAAQARPDQPRRDWREDERRDDARDNDRRNDDRRNWDRDDRRRDQQRRTYGYGYGDNNGWRGQSYDRSRFEDRRAWNRGWRSENRYDWTRYRSVNRNAYRLPRYYAPYGWNSYRRLSIGLSLAPQLWGQNYWIADPWSYRLPDAYGQYRWVRYYDDALLVDLDSGQVVDAVYGIFW